MTCVQVVMDFWAPLQYISIVKFFGLYWPLRWTGRCLWFCCCCCRCCCMVPEQTPQPPPLLAVASGSGEWGNKLSRYKTAQTLCPRARVRLLGMWLPSTWVWKRSCSPGMPFLEQRELRMWNGFDLLTQVYSSSLFLRNTHMKSCENKVLQITESGDHTLRQLGQSKLHMMNE